MKITGTFLDEITHDIPSNNWGRQEWAEDFKLMRSIGIDTVILIRAGVGWMAACPSQVLTTQADIYPVYEDLVDLFLDLAEANEMAFFFGTYDSATWPTRDRTLDQEVALGKAFVDEVWAKYGDRKAFQGWYLTFELGKMERRRVDCLRELGLHCKHLSPQLPNLISPYVHGGKQFEDAISLTQHCADWDEILSMLEGAVDIVAFQDGQVQFDELPDFLHANLELIRKHGMQGWSNTESFDRDMPFNFPPIDWRKLRWKMDAAEQAGVDKLITFEFSHFMSPQSAWPAAKHLF
ncbi:MAG: DUF4434 domain-containing protein, partial [Thermosynechococcaceae cyanobacterium]